MVKVSNINKVGQKYKMHVLGNG